MSNIVILSAFHPGIGRTVDDVHAAASAYGKVWLVKYIEPFDGVIVIYSRCKEAKLACEKVCC